MKFEWNKKTGWTLLAQRTATMAVFRLVRLIFTSVQRVFWELNGTAKQVREAEDPRYYERSAHVLDVVMERHFCEQQNHAIEHFICVHNRFENPQFVIDNEHITLFTINERHAVFGVAIEKDMRLWKTEYSSFMRMAQPVYCNQLIVVPLSVFHKMAETIGDPKAQLIIIFNTARCGSTLLTQIFEYTDRCVAVSEPDSMTLVATKYRIEGNTPEVRQLARDVIRWECRPYPSMQPLAYALKLSSPAAVALDLFLDLYPNSRNLFMYRDVVKVAQSLYRMSYTLPSIWLVCKFARLSSAILVELANSMGLDGRDFRYKLRNDLHIGFIVACIAMKSYVDLLSTGRTNVAGIRYEDLVDDPTESVRRIIEFCHLPEELVQPGLRGLEVDSQRNSVIAKSTIGGIPNPKLTPEAKEIANELLRKNGLPLIGEECLLQGTITYQKRAEGSRS